MNEEVINPQNTTPPIQPPTNENQQPVIQQPEIPPQQPTVSPTPQPAVTAPMQPAVQAPATTPQLSTPSAPVAEPTPTASVNVEYNSNPFIATGKGLGSALVTNPVASLLLAIIPFLAIFAAGTIAGLGAILGPIVALILVVVMIIVTFIVFLRTIAGSIVVLLESNKGNKITTREAIGKLSTQHLTSFVGASFLGSIFIFFGLLAFIIPGIFLMARLSLAPVLVYSEGLKAMAAIKRSFSLTKGHAFEMLGALTAQSMIGSTGLLAVVGTYSGVARRYIELAELEKSGELKSTKTHWLNFVAPLIFVIIFVPYLVLSAYISSQPTPSNDFYNDTQYEFMDSNIYEDPNNSFEFDSNYQYDYDYDYEN